MQMQLKRRKPTQVALGLQATCLTALLGATSALAAPTSSTGAVLPPVEIGVLPSLRGGDFDRAVERALRTSAWNVIDPTLVEADALQIRSTAFGKKLVVRVTPTVDGVVVENGDRVLVYRNGAPERASVTTALNRRGSFRLSAEEAVTAASATSRGSLFVDPTVERVAAFAKQVWLGRVDGIHAAYKVRVPTASLRDLNDVWVDADTGVILMRQPVAKFADGGPLDGGFVDGGDIIDGGGIIDGGDPVEDAGVVVDAGPVDLPAAPTAAEAFVYAPVPGDLSANLNLVELEGLLPANVGGHLRGQWVETYNCCKEYVCTNGLEECEIEDQRCATPDDDDVIESQLALELPASLVPLPFPGDVIFARTVFCAELPRVKSQPADGDTAAGWYETPVDSQRTDNQVLGLASEEDAFAEVQAYYATMSFFAHVRDVLDDQTWCLGGVSMQCEADGSPVLDPDSGLPVRPFHVASNVMLPVIDIQALAAQLFAGKGASAGDPLLIDDFMRLDNAVFLPALDGGNIGIPEEFGALVDIFNRTYDSNLYFQGTNDFAYDGSIVFHEFTHGIVHSMAPGLLSQFHDEWGSHAEPGSMNEGWADYFSASYRNDPVIGTYGAAGLNGGETGLRDATNDKKCPDDIVGEVHDDSEPWSASLWEIRDAVIAAEGETAISRLDRLLLSTMAESNPAENFAAQSARIVTEVTTEFGATVGDAATTAFAAHGMSACERVWNLATVNDAGDGVDVQIKPVIYLGGPSDVGLENVAPAVLQLRVEVPAGSTGFSLRWSESAGGLATQFTGGGEPPILLTLVHEGDAPVEWRYEGNGGSIAVPYDSATGERIPFDITADENKITLSGENATFDVVLESDPCEARTFIAHILNPTATTTLSNIDLVAFDSEGTCDPGDEDAGPGGTDPEPPPADCGCDVAGGTGGDADAGGPLFALFLAGIGALMLRRRRRQS